MKTMNKIQSAASILGALGGKSTSPAKQAASRANGKLGGRPTATHTVTMKPQLYDVKTRDGKLVKRSMTARDALALARRINGQEIKIGTCEQMYYLRADQVSLIESVSGSVNPRRRDEAEQIRFRFPFPDEDHVKPGAFEPYDRAFAVYGLEVPEDIEHYHLQFTRNYPSSGGILLSTPCPRSKEGKASGLKWSYNGYSGSVGIHSQRLVGDELVLILRCMDCGALWRVPTLEEAKPVLDKLTEDGFSRKIAMRIIDGYTKPNFWTKQLVAA